MTQEKLIEELRKVNRVAETGDMITIYQPRVKELSYMVDTNTLIICFFVEVNGDYMNAEESFTNLLPETILDLFRKWNNEL